MWGYSAEKSRAVPKKLRGCGSDGRLQAEQGEAGSELLGTEPMVMGPSFSEESVNKAPGQWLLS